MHNYSLVCLSSVYLFVVDPTGQLLSNGIEDASGDSGDDESEGEL